MLTLIQFPWSPFCITVRHILEQHGILFRLRNIPFSRAGLHYQSHKRTWVYGALPRRWKRCDLR